ncbi:aminoglycoside phosphotransferase family protein [Actinacidiphila bryophytorum]|uniref:aminoglycoside phosphotransferase family protein n=1 Tax=Actinacidiphila bryophytorum TaxID=1436133 RepID=UPI002176B6BA|nr:aminoglycoside phosphotransferase family protein [Actinacidiphila bryophytorum]UWE13094.1 aminoglycoside phosphotransferase family protein [Actinacidiphila bryophytorum]
MLDDIAPIGVRVPPRVLHDVAALFGELVRVPCEALPGLPAHWPADGDTAAFAHRLSAVALAIHRTFQAEFADLLAALGVPQDPLAPAVDRWSLLHPRPFRLLHCDIHRKNVIVDRQRSVFIDWQLALWGDPLYDLAAHLHKMGYLPEERAAVTAAWVAAVPPECSSHWQRDLEIYLTHEKIKSAVVDGVRYTERYAQTPEDAGERRALAARLAVKLAAARPFLGGGPRRTPAEVEEVMRGWAETRKK